MFDQPRLCLIGDNDSVYDELRESEIGCWIYIWFECRGLTQVLPDIPIIETCAAFPKHALIG